MGINKNSKKSVNFSQINGCYESSHLNNLSEDFSKVKNNVNSVVFNRIVECFMYDSSVNEESINSNIANILNVKLLDVDRIRTGERELTVKDLSIISSHLKMSPDLFFTEVFGDNDSQDTEFKVKKIP